MQRFNLNQMVIEPLLHNLAIVLVILVPAITMRSFAEEVDRHLRAFVDRAAADRRDRGGQIYRGRGLSRRS